jgi:hypothetical protein
MWPKDASAVVVAFDNANPADPAYADGWANGDNGGFGFGPWGGLNAFTQEIDTAGYPDNNIGTPAFRYGAEYYTADRPFANPMTAGQSFKMDFDKHAYETEFAEGSYGEQDSLIRLSSVGGERFSFYDWIYQVTVNGVTTLYNANQAGEDQWGIGADSAFDNLNGGAPLPDNGDPNGILFLPNYSGPDSTDGFTFILDLPTIDTYRLRILDDNVTKVDVFGALRSTSGSPPNQVSLLGQGINALSMWFTPGDYDLGTPAAYFTNLTIESPGVSGDYNGNGTVDAADYLLWRKGGPLINDPTSGVDPSDYTYWRSRFGATSGSGTGFGSSIPEPCSWVLLLLVLCAAVCRRDTRF